jgi:hypothetical protein
MNTEDLGMLLQPKLNPDGFYLEGVYTVNKLDIQTHASVYMVMFCIFAVYLLHGNQRVGRVLLFHPLKQNTTPHQKLQRK